MTYSLYISSASPYSFKASALLGYAGVPCDIERENVVNRYTVLERLTGETMVPVLREGEWAMNDSTAIARWALDQTERPLLPEGDSLESICWLLEEFADEWVSLWGAYGRWFNEEDAAAVRRVIGRELACGVPLASRSIGRISEMVVRRELARTGVAESNRRALRQSRDRVLQGLENHLEGSAGYLFGDHPTVADFALYGQLEQYRRGPTGRGRMEMYPAVSEWLDGVDRMRLPHPVVPIRHGTSLELEGLKPLIAEFFGSYWRLLAEVHRSVHDRASRPDAAPNPELEVELIDGTTFRCRPTRRLAGRVDFALERFEHLLAEGSEAIGPGGIAVGDAIDDALERLATYPAGRSAIEGYEHLSERI